uniref:Uncharacterized protein n=2 Tax=viral metagenome TaxID=1070528 RepID=A0A6H1ZVJ8_9ZZZZ
MMNQGQPERERYIPNQLGRLEKAVGELEDFFGDLQGRLQYVRSEEVEKTTSEKEQEIALSCPAAESLRVQVLRIQSINNRIQNQLKLLEI